MTNEEKVRLVLDVLGVESISSATRAMKDMAQAVDDLDESIGGGLIESSGEFWIQLRDGQRLLANTAEGFRKLLDDEGRFLIKLADGRKVWSDSTNGINAINDALLKYQQQAKAAAQATEKFEDDLQDLSSFARQLGADLRKGLAEPLEEVAYSISGRGKDGKVVLPSSKNSDEGVLAYLQKIQNFSKGTAFESAGKTVSELGQKFSKNGDLGRGILEASYLIDDLQYGFGGVVNNVPRIAHAFGLASAAVGGVGIAVVAANQVINILYKLLPEGEKPLESLKTKLADFAQGMGASKAEVEKLSNEIEKMATKAVPGLFTSLDTSLKKINELIKAQKDLEALKKEEEEKRAAAEAERQNREKRAAADQERADPAKAFLEGLLPDQEQALADKLKRDQLQKGRNDAVAEQLAALDRGGAFADATVFGMAIPFLNRGGTALRGTERAEQRKKMREDEARKKLQAQITEQSPEAAAFAGQRADEIIAKARSGDRQAIIILQGISPELADFIKQEEADKEFDRSIEKRAATGQKRREALARQKAEDAKIQQETAREKQATEKRLRELGVIGGRRLDDGTIIGGDAIDDDTAEKAQEALKNMVGGFKKTEAENQTENAGVVAARNAALGQFDPLQAAILRRQQAGVGGMSKRNLQALEQRDIRNFQQLLMNQGMGRGEAEQAAMESLRGGEASFQDMARGLGFSLDTVADGFRASVAVMQQLKQTVQRIDGENQALRQQLQMMGNGDNRAPARPQLRRRLNN